jgi:hypothetical protein
MERNATNWKCEYYQIITYLENYIKTVDKPLCTYYNVDRAYYKMVAKNGYFYKFYL